MKKLTAIVVGSIITGSAVFSSILGKMIYDTYPIFTFTGNGRVNIEEMQRKDNYERDRIFYSLKYGVLAFLSTTMIPLGIAYEISRIDKPK